ncbi:RNase A-like domain-containing protein [Paraburkholderia susongensis]|uniref:Bacterial CdiA-CT RNAse A domain-containing protein n=1 Tax=Paraburkholderia susongensis TaxID=1515439 RepID=A0A1X7M3Y7_9BURK|nr:RNase A-like domain-containing protein [Paraburkholderia susongensis]SMG60815.1 hypothetical protein SAMN06265784_1181 [Paraburkholderia susongensis]
MSYQQDSDGVRVVLSAPQLAAVLTRQSISRSEMASNWLWGGLQIVGGVLEMVGAAALCVLPDPTMASKAGCIVFGVHGSDTAAAGLRQVWTGQDTATLTLRGTAKLAEAMKVSPDMANNIGLSLDIAVSVGVAGSIKAVRASEITMGRIKLMDHEAKALNPKLGGHTILKHVEKDETWLRNRLKHEPKRTTVSSFRSIESAEWAISEVMQHNASRIQAWTQSTARSKPLELTRDVGYETYNGMPYYVMTASLF